MTTIVGCLLVPVVDVLSTVYQSGKKQVGEKFVSIAGMS